ncbi:MAG: hypothetical protein MK188_05395 [Gammaproteobacteria bacterium]|nr:hypothetical protein [Gammaproteobacteria bacterium]
MFAIIPCTNTTKINAQRQSPVQRSPTHPRDPTMQIDRPMANLFFQIKRSIPFEHQHDMKIASPLIGEKLISLYQKSHDQLLRALIREFLRRAGDNWVSQLDAIQSNDDSQNRAFSSMKH